MPDAISTQGTHDKSTSDLRLTLVGPFPPPINGQSMVMDYMATRLSTHFHRLEIADTAGPSGIPGLGAFGTMRRSLAVWWSIRNSEVVYIAVKAGKGMWLTSATAGFARLAGTKVFLHHHSYSYVRRRKFRMVALTRIAGPDARHIVLSRSMARDLVRSVPEISRPFIIGNACLVDQGLLDLPLRNDQETLTLGHLSNLTLEKGIGEVIDLALALHRAGVRIRLIVGGPTVDREAGRHLDRAANELGDQFEYRGPLTGAAKKAFFEDVTHFIFPSRYIHEAVPLVLYEAMAAGAVCIATRQGSISEQLEDSPSIVAANQDSFVKEALPRLIPTSVSQAESRASRQAYLHALVKAEHELDDFIALLGRIEHKSRC